MRKVALYVVALGVLAAGAARADTYEFTYHASGSQQLGFGGTVNLDLFITTGAADGFGYDVTSISGTVNTFTSVTGLDGSYGSPDNILYTTNSPYVDSNGISFDTAYDSYRLFSTDGTDVRFIDIYVDNATSPDFTLTDATPAAVPEQSSIALLTTALLGMIAIPAVRRRMLG